MQQPQLHIVAQSPFFLQVSGIEGLVGAHLQALPLPAFRVAGKTALIQPDNAVGKEIGDPFLMGHHDHQAVPGGLTQQGADIDGIGLVQIARRFIGEDDPGPPGQGPGNGHTLLLAAGQITDSAVDIPLHVHRLQRRADAAQLFPVAQLKAVKAKVNIVANSMLFQQIVVLENVTEVSVSLGFVGGGAVAGDGGLPGGQGTVVKSVQAAQGVQEAGLAAAGGTQNTHEALIRQVEGHILQHPVITQLGPVIGLIEMFYPDHTSTSSSICRSTKRSATG